jgi:hypothetical protein
LTAAGRRRSVAPRRIYLPTAWICAPPTVGGGSRDRCWSAGRLVASSPSVVGRLPHVGSASPGKVPRLDLRVPGLGPSSGMLGGLCFRWPAGLRLPPLSHFRCLQNSGAYCYCRRRIGSWAALDGFPPLLGGWVLGENHVWFSGLAMMAFVCHVPLEGVALDLCSYGPSCRLRVVAWWMDAWRKPCSDSD